MSEVEIKNVKPHDGNALLTAVPTSCLDCPFHKVIPDPDPEDWFCDDDVAIVCLKTKNDRYNLKSKYQADKQPFKCVTVACRPHHIKKESDTPDWCPLRHGS